MVRARLHWSAPLLWLLFLTAATPSLAIENDFSFYPKGAQGCLKRAAKKADCSEAPDVPKLNECLCGNTGNFITKTAQCLGKEAPDDVDETYKTMRDACNDSDTPIELSQKEFGDAADNQPSPTSSDGPATETATAPASTSTTSSTDDAGGGLSTGAMIGIAVGSSLVGAGIVAGICWWLFRRYRRRHGGMHGMLPQHSEDGGSPSGYAGTASSLGMAKWSPAPTLEPAWKSPVSDYGGPQQEVLVELPQDNATRFEMEGSGVSHQTAVEMAGSIPAAREN